MKLNEFVNTYQPVNCAVQGIIKFTKSNHQALPLMIQDILQENPENIINEYFDMVSK